MKSPINAHDTISRWIALTIAMAMLVLLLLNTLFTQAAGVWAKPPLRQTGLLEQIASISRVIQAAPVELRDHLATAVTNPGYTVRWFRHQTDIATPVHTNDHDITRTLRAVLGRADRGIEAFEPQDWGDDQTHKTYLMLVELDDRSWLSFETPVRSWGLDKEVRNGIVFVLTLVSTLLVALVATRRLARPLQSFARAARRFGDDFHAPPIIALGPREIREATVAFNTMQAQIQRFVADRTHMLAAISHDLRAPLTRMRLRGEFIEDPEQQSKLFRDVDEMDVMINSALEFFRDEARLEQTTPFDLAELLLTIIDDYRDQGIAVEFEGPLKLVYAGRPQGLKRAIVNLIENAVKYGTCPRLLLARHAEGVILEVIDRGPGIARDSLEQVFAPFFRLEQSRNRTTGGVGLGLPAARAIVVGHGGHLSLRNAAEGGLIARIELPTTQPGA
ncbi:MAG TPA: ATP-binding protein [Pseudomonas sp.]|uniref:ATP-binding protein n=1 Tax=Pseudomonas sp. TaxID=306 RepID=UPI002EDAE7B6